MTAQPAAFAGRRLEEPVPHLIPGARCEKVRESGIVRPRAVLIAPGVGPADRESRSSWKDFLTGLKERGLDGVRLAVSDGRAGLRKAVPEVLPGGGPAEMLCPFPEERAGPHAGKA